MPPPRSKKTKPTADQSQEPPSFELYCAVVQFVFEHGAGSVHEAVRQKKREILRELCRAGININTTRAGKTALTEAISRDDDECVEELLAAKADPCARADNRGSSLHVACEKGKVEIVKKLLAAGGTKGINDFCVEIVDRKEKDWTALMKSSSKGHLDIVETLVAAKADVNRTQKYGISAAFYASDNRCSAVLEVLLKAGADVLHHNTDGQSLMHAAARSGSTHCLRMLIEAKACVLTPDKYGESPLMTAALFGGLLAMRMLIEAKADANAANKDGDTPLHFAALSGEDEAIKVLVIEGQACLDVKNNRGETPLQRAPPESSTHAILTEMELVGADEHVLVKGAAKRFKPLGQ